MAEKENNATNEIKNLILYVKRKYEKILVFFYSISVVSVFIKSDVFASPALPLISFQNSTLDLINILLL